MAGGGRAGVSGITQSTALWYASRATGVVCFVLLTVVVLLGILVNRQGRLPGLPRFAVTGLHRSISLLAVVFLAIHVITAIADKYVTIQLIAAVVPFTSSYLPFQVGLGAVALDLIAALIITSLLRARVGRRLWRGVHWLAYAAYPVALLHSWTSAKDMRSGGLLALTVVCVLGVGAAAGYRLAAARTGRRAALPVAPPGVSGYRTAAAPGRPPPGGQARAAAGAPYPAGADYPESARYPGGAGYADGTRYPAGAGHAEGTRYPAGASHAEGARYPAGAGYAEGARYPEATRPLAGARHPEGAVLQDGTGR
jgi:methionine sulfoxide reductase heme-binding subunit